MTAGSTRMMAAKQVNDERRATNHRGSLRNSKLRIEKKYTTMGRPQKVKLVKCLLSRRAGMSKSISLPHSSPQVSILTKPHLWFQLYSTAYAWTKSTKRRGATR